ncbi:MAG TPA: DASS family sodium-coupled anion symporter [Steroidobacteraceae bacterium]|nr:DASS family sodium-coupled anion symporter [Steroidobacteraceae bacterium]
MNTDSRVARTIGVAAHTATASPAQRWWKAGLPLAIVAVVALLPAPEGLAQHAWYYFAIFCGVIAALVVEPLPGPAIGVVGVTAVTVLARWVLFSPEQQAAEGFSLAEDSLEWALSGFSSPTVWLVFSAFMFALGYEKTGLGRRIALMLVRRMGKSTLSLGYATALADAALAPFTPSNTARSAGTIFPVVRNLPPLYDSCPHDPSARRVGGYIMWTTFAATCVTSSLFMTGLAPNLLARELAGKIAGVHISWQSWFFGAAPFAVPLLLALPLLVYAIYPPQVRHGSQVPVWAARQLEKRGKPSRQEVTLMVLVLLAIVLWIFGAEHVEAATAALIVVSLMLVTRIATWKEMAKNHAAWTTLTLLATLVTLAGGLSQTGFIKWFAGNVAAHIGGLPPTITVMGLVTVYFLSHYMFASLTAHTTAMFPVLLAVGLGIPGVPPDKLALALALATGIMGVITPYATGPALVYYESGYIPAAHFWRLGMIFGAIFLAALLFVGVPILMKS